MMRMVKPPVVRDFELGFNFTLGGADLAFAGLSVRPRHCLSSIP